MTQPLESSFQALSIDTIITVRPPASPSPKHSTFKAAPSMTIVTCEISKSDHLDQVEHEVDWRCHIIHCSGKALAQYTSLHSAPSILGWRRRSQKATTPISLFNDSWHDRIKTLR